MPDRITVTETDGAVSVSSVGVQGPPGVTSSVSGLATLAGETGVSVVFDNEQDSSNYVVVFEQQVASDVAGFVERSKAEIWVPTKATTGFTAYSADSLSGVSVRWTLIFY